MVRATPSDPTTRRRGQRNASGARLRALGPAVFVSAGYVDPGNWATDVAAGAKFGFSLIWVLAAATLAALFIQQLSARLGVASGEDLATLMHTRLGINVRRLIVPPVLCALVVTEIVEVLGVVIGIQLLTGWPAYQAIPAACLLVLVVVLAPRRFGRGVVYGCLGFVSLVYLVLLADHGLGDVAAGMRPTTLPPGGLPVAIGIVGAVIMPHNVLLHSTLARDLRRQTDRDVDRRLLLRSSLITMGLSLFVAFAINCAITSLTARPVTGRPPVDGMNGAFSGLQQTYGLAASALFAITLLAAGLAACATTGQATGNVIAALVPRLRLRDSSRRLLCLVPAVAVAGCGLPPVATLVWSQVLLTAVLPLVLAPLVFFTCQRSLMGLYVLTMPHRVAALLVTGALLVAGPVALTIG